MTTNHPSKTGATPGGLTPQGAEVITLKARHSTQQATLRDSVIELRPDTDSNGSTDGPSGPSSHPPGHTTLYERSETETTLNQPTPRGRHPSRQRVGWGARRATFGNVRLGEPRETAAPQAQDRNTASDSEVQVITDSDSSQGYEYLADRSETYTDARTTTLEGKRLREFGVSGERAAASTHERDSTSDDGSIGSEPGDDGHSTGAEHLVIHPPRGEMAQSGSEPPSEPQTPSTRSSA